jgi:hypothetical protein
VVCQVWRGPVTHMVKDGQDWYAANFARLPAESTL